MADSNISELDAVTAVDDADLFYLGHGGVDKKITGAHLKTAATAGAGDVTGPAANTDSRVPQWNGADSKTLKDGLAIGVAANALVQLDGSGKLPAIDASALTTIDKYTQAEVDAAIAAIVHDATKIQGFEVSTTDPTNGQILKYDSGTSKYEPVAQAGGGDVTGPASNTDNSVPQWNGADSKTLKDGLAVGTGANNLVQLDGSSKLPAVDGSALTNIVAGDVDGPATNTADHIPQWNGADSKTLKDGLAVGTGANNLVQLDASSKLPAVDGSALTGLSSSGDARWTEIDSGKYTATPLVTSEIAMSDTSDMKKALPLRYTYNSVVYYGMVESVQTDTKIILCGAPLNTGHDLTKLEVGLPEMVVQVDFFVAGTFADATNNELLKTDANTRFDWNLSNAYLVILHICVGSADTGVDGPNVNVSLGGIGATYAVSTYNTNLGPEALDNSAWYGNAYSSIDASKYDVAYDDKIELMLSATGSNGDAEDLTVSCVFVLE